VGVSATVTAAVTGVSAVASAACGSVASLGAAWADDQQAIGKNGGYQQQRGIGLRENLNRKPWFLA